MVKILDCTLRDGGYVNNWSFGYENIKLTLNKQVESGVEIIECGFLKNRINYSYDTSLFDSIERLKEIIPSNKGKSKFVCMINYGDYEADEIPEYDGRSVEGIRLVFHKKDLKGAIDFANRLSCKGYNLFIQPMVTINYSDEELLALIEKVNEIKPYAFYIVDSFGVMKKNDLIRLSYLMDNNLDKGICLGYHSHNNLQLAYSNAQNFLEVATKRTKIIDSSIYGMGRGAGNLNTELFMEYLNESKNKNYKIEPLLEVIDEVLENIYLEKKWGYSLPYYLSAKWNCHPNYGLYLEKLGTLTVQSINTILSKIQVERRDSFDKEYINNLYIQYQSQNLDDSRSLKKLKSLIEGREVLIVAPGKNLEKEGEKVQSYIEEMKPVTISVNFTSKECQSDYVFVSNEKRYSKLNDRRNLIVTSNIEVSELDALKINYNSLIGDNEEIKDNAAIMLIRLLNEVGVKKVLLVGMDGYSYNNEENYIRDEISAFKTIDQVHSLNIALSKELKNLANKVEIEFLTTSRYNVSKEN